MRITTALLADHALAHPTDGRLYVTGGGIRSLSFPSFPANYPHLALALGIELEQRDLGKKHTLRIETSGPAGQPLTGPVRVTFEVPSDSGRPNQGLIHFVSNMDNVTFPIGGEYLFIAYVNETRELEVRLDANLRGERPDDVEAARLREADSLVAAGFTAYAEGDPLRAEKLFRSAVEHSPKHAGAHNNLGFVLLGRGDAKGALGAFGTAREFGFPQDEISDANVACALYVDGQHEAALARFADCLKTHVFRGPAVLFGIDATGLFSIQLVSAADYAALMGLNASWCALRMGDSEAVANYLKVARAGEATFEGRPGRDAFDRSLRALTSTTASAAPAG